MPSMRRRRPRRRLLRALASLAGLACMLATPGPALAVVKPRVVIVAMPREEAESFLSGSIAALGLGVFPDSRVPARFIHEIGLGAPVGKGSAEELGGSAGKLGRAISSAGFTVAVATGGPTRIQEALTFALSPDPADATPVARATALQADVAGLWVDTRDELDSLIEAHGTKGVVVLGIGERTPVVVGVALEGSRQATEQEHGWLLANGIARRPGIVTPYDLAALILTQTGAALPAGVELPLNGGVDLRVPGGGFIGKAMRLDAPRGGASSALPELDEIERRIVRDADYGLVHAVVIDALSIGSIVFALLLLWTGRRGLAKRAAQGAWYTVGGFAVSLFLPTGRAEIRVIPVAAACLIGYAVTPRDPPRTFGRIALGLSIAFAILVAVAPLRPGGEPGLSIWGDPLVSWRFFGLRNVEAAFIAGGALVGGVLAGLRWPGYAALAAPVAVVIGAPVIGANFVGVLTFVFGASLATVALARGRVEWWHVGVAGALAVGAFVLALLADAGSPVSHGGQAAKRISEGGLDVAFGFVRARLALNIDLIRDFFGGIAFVAMLLIAMGSMLAWGARAARGSLRGRVAVWAGAATALASLVLEDSGFFSGAAFALVTGAVFVLVAAGLHGPPASSATPEPPAAGG